jgi:hypothetical protein
MHDGGQFHEMRICSTADERLAHRLVAMQEANRNTGFDANYCSWYLDYLPQRIGDSVALRDSIECFLACWENSRRGIPYQQILSRKLYGKSLRSLQHALNDPAQRYTTGTFAASAVLCKTEAWFYRTPHRNKITD